jgi:hypothetical protein
VALGRAVLGCLAGRGHAQVDQGAYRPVAPLAARVGLGLFRCEVGFDRCAFEGGAAYEARDGSSAGRPAFDGLPRLVRAGDKLRILLCAGDVGIDRESCFAGGVAAAAMKCSSA